MPSADPLHLRLVEPHLRPAALRLEPRDDELAWVGTAGEMLPAAEDDPTRLPVLMVVGDAPVGFLTLDWGARSRRYAAPDALGIHGFLVDRRRRRHGHARSALMALPTFVREHLPPDWAALMLTVNVRNAPAIATYTSAGFTDTGRLFLGGAAGPQHVMGRPLDDVRP